MFVIQLDELAGRVVIGGLLDCIELLALFREEFTEVQLCSCQYTATKVKHWNGIRTLGIALTLEIPSVKAVESPDADTSINLDQSRSREKHAQQRPDADPSCSHCPDLDAILVPSEQTKRQCPQPPQPDPDGPQANSVQVDDQPSSSLA